MNGSVRSPAGPAPGGRRPPAPWLRYHGVAVLLACAGWAVLAAVMLTGPGPFRFTMVFAFALVCPGLAVVRLLPLRDFLERAVLSVALGLSLAALTAEATAIAHVLRPSAALVVLATICSAAAVVELAGGVWSS